MDQTPLERILSALDQQGYGPAVKNGKEYRVRCPAHQDKTPSLDVCEGREGRVVFNCRSASCSFNQIMQALGLKDSDGFPKSTGKLPKGETIVAVYNYLDENRKLMLQVQRTVDKQFWQRQPDPDQEGRWIYNLKWVRRVPYRFPELLASPASDPVFVCEGEKDCDNVAKLGLVTTTNSGGAGKFHTLADDSLYAFNGRRVVVVPDNDTAGEAHVASVWKTLREIASSIQVVKLPGLGPKGDVSDWIRGGGTAAALLALADSAEPVDLESINPPGKGDAYEPPPPAAVVEQPVAKVVDAAKIFAWKPSPNPFNLFMRADYAHRWLIRKLLVAAEPVVWFGPSKVMKTSTIVDACICLASGRPFLGTFEIEEPKRVLLISGESGEATLQSIARRVCEARGVDPDEVGDRLTMEISVPPLSDLATLATLKDLLTTLKTDLVVIDPAYLTLLGGPGGGADKAPNMFAMGEAIGGLAAVCRANKRQLILVHHTNGSLRVGDEPSLQHIAYAGFQQFTRQWIGINRREPYEHNGKSELILVAGGSAGHGGKWHLTVDEGTLGEDFGGKIWDVTVTAAFEAEALQRTEKEKEKEEREAAKLESDMDVVEKAIGRLCTGGGMEAATKNKLADETGWGHKRVDRALHHLIQAERIKEKKIEVASGPGGKAKRAAIGYVCIDKRDMFN